MVTNLNDQAVFKVGNRLIAEENSITKEIEIMNYSSLVNQLERKTLLVEKDGKYVLIKFGNYSVLESVSEFFYEIQLRGYVPIIANAELNMDFRRNPNKLYSLVAKGALVQIDESSLLGKKGKVIRKFATKLCRHRLVHIVSSESDMLTKKHTLSEKVSTYLRKKVSMDYVNYLQSNATHIKEGMAFHPKTAIKFRDSK